MEFTPRQAIDGVVRSAKRPWRERRGGRWTPGHRATGLIFGRNVWQWQHNQSIAFIGRLQEIFAKYPR